METENKYAVLMETNDEHCEWDFFDYFFQNSNEYISNCVNVLLKFCF